MELLPDDDVPMVSSLVTPVVRVVGVAVVPVSSTATVVAADSHTAVAGRRARVAQAGGVLRNILHRNAFARDIGPRIFTKALPTRAGGIRERAVPERLANALRTPVDAHSVVVADEGVRSGAAKRKPKRKPKRAGPQPQRHPHLATITRGRMKLARTRGRPRRRRSAYFAAHDA